MSEFQRYAVYYLPEDDALAGFGAAWLGWDVALAAPVDHPETDLPLAEFTATPRKYGFHGTLKPPFRLAEGRTADGLFAAVAALAAASPAVELRGLELAGLGHFLALVPEGGAAGLADLAARIVTDLDGFRAAPTPEDLARRRAGGLTPRQDEMLAAWGYPYVLDEFRFHLTLTGRLGDRDLTLARTEAARLLPPLPRPFRIRSISVAGQRPDGRFVALHRYALTG
ncbi:MAG: DUF1045 domain-containing protein [Paracoccaceae bacterium]|nr:DUF1045 domain-containing protein [Paracoccaceae bacterium]